MASNVIDAEGPSKVPEEASANAHSPWGRRADPVVVDEANTSLNDIMSEQLAASLELQEQERLTKQFLATQNIPETSEDLVEGEGDDCSSDQAIARMLQMQFNKELDEEVKRREQKYNGSSKVSVSFSNYMVTPVDESDSDEEDDVSDDKKAWDSFEAHEKAFP